MRIFIDNLVIRCVDFINKFIFDVVYCFDYSVFRIISDWVCGEYYFSSFGKDLFLYDYGYL